jgi:hypothetical protein
MVVEYLVQGVLESANDDASVIEAQSAQVNLSARSQRLCAFQAEDLATAVHLPAGCLIRG